MSPLSEAQLVHCPRTFFSYFTHLFLHFFFPSVLTERIFAFRLIRACEELSHVKKSSLLAYKRKYLPYNPSNIFARVWSECVPLLNIPQLKPGNI